MDPNEPFAPPPLRIHSPPAEPRVIDAVDYMHHVHGRRVDVVARVRVRGLWRVRWAERLVRLAGRLLRAKYQLKTIDEEV